MKISKHNSPIHKVIQFLYLPLTFLFLFALSLSYAQQQPDGSSAQQNLDKLGERGNQGLVRIFDNRYEGVKGTPFYNDEWLYGDLIAEDNSHYENVRLKYNSYEDELLLYKGSSAPIYLFKEQIREFTLKYRDSTEARFVKMRIDRGFRFHKVIYKGSYNVYEEITTSLRKADYQGGYSANRPYDEFETYSIFYYSQANSDALDKLKASPSKVAGIFPDKNQKIKEYIRNNQLDCKSAKDLAKIFSYYDSL